MQVALRDAGIEADDIDYINAHGTSTPMNDAFETEAIKTVFGEHARPLAVSSTKSMTGHLLGAAAAIETVFCLKAIETGCFPRRSTWITPIPDCDLDYVPNQARSKDHPHGHVQHLRFRRCERRPDFS